VRAIKNGMKGKWSGIWHFTTKAKTNSSTGNLSAPKQVAPSDKENNVSVKPNFKWKAVDAAGAYILDVSHGNKMVLHQRIDSTGFTPKKAWSAKTTYYWRVRAIRNGTKGKWSAIHSFTTAATGSNSGSGNTNTSGSGNTNSGGSGSNSGGSGSNTGYSSNAKSSVSGDRQALMDLYKATNGSGWSHHSGWGTGEPMGSWYGIKTNSRGRVVRVNLYGNNLTGSLPASIGNLTKVTYFNVKQNHISGHIPSSIGNMRSVVYLLLNGVKHDPDYLWYHPGKPYNHALRTNRFTGALPASIGNLSNLKWLAIAGDGGQDKYNGKYVLHTGITSVPSSLDKLTQLKGLILSFAPISRLPNLGSLTNMKILSLEGCIGLKGQQVPSWIPRMTHLRSLWADHVGFTGSFPDISDATGLRFLMVSKNEFTGHFPAYAIDGTMPHMNMLTFAWNKLTGTLPEFGASQGVNLTMFDVTGNSLTGSVPANVATQTRMINLGFGWNNFSGHFPSDLTGLHHLRWIYANNNNFTGTLPKVDTADKHLEFLYFQNNQMSGKVPVSLAGIDNLPRIGSGDLRINNNNFSQADVQGLINALKADGKLNVLKY